MEKSKLEAIKRRLKILEVSPMLGRILIQQNKIQIYLSKLIIIRVSKRSLINKKLKDSIYNSTLGKIIILYRFCSNKIEKKLFC